MKRGIARLFCTGLIDASSSVANLSVANDVANTEPRHGDTTHQNPCQYTRRARQHHLEPATRKFRRKNTMAMVAPEARDANHPEVSPC